MNQKGSIVLTRHLALLLAKIAPVIGVFVFISAIQATGSEVGLWTELWRIGMSIGLGIFVTLVGMIYQNLNKRLEVLENVAREDMVPRKEYDHRHDDLIDRLKRIETAVLK